MTARSLRTGENTGPAEDADELDVEEALALVRNDHDRAPGDHPPAPGGTSAGHGPRHTPGHVDRPPTAHRPDAHHKATPWPEARAGAARAARAVTRGARRAPVSVRLDDALGLTLAAPLDALTDLPSFATSAIDGR